MSSQLPLDLEVRNPHDKRYFVLHSGVVEAMSAIDEQLQQLVTNPRQGSVFFVRGVPGVGKSHFLAVVKAKAEQRNINTFVSFDSLTPEVCSSLEWQRKFISEFQRIQAEGGILLCSSSYAIHELCQDPSVLSRLRAAIPLLIENPADEELVPIIHSIAEKRNLQISQVNLDYIVKRLPRNLLSFEHFFATIDRLCLSSGRPARLPIIRSAISDCER